MLKKLIVVAGTILSATVVSGVSASAAPHHTLRAHHVGALHRAGRGRSFAFRKSLARHARHLHAGRPGALARLGRGRHVARLDRHLRTRVASAPSTAIQNYVGPRSAYGPASTPIGAGVQVGGASFYSGGRTANGGVVGTATCAHRSLPFGTRVLVTNLANGAKTVLTVNDRGPFVRGRILDVSRSAASMLGMVQSGTARIAMQVIGGRGGPL